MVQATGLVLKRTKVWWDAARWMALPQSAMPCLVAGLIAFYHGLFDPVRFLVTFIGLMAVSLGTYLLDDYADLKIAGFSVRNELQQAGDIVRTTKAPHVVNGTIKLNHVLYVSLGLFTVGIMACVYLAVVSGWPVAAIATGGAFICFFYSMPPLSLCYRGMGEAAVAVSMGPMICVGTYYAVAQCFSWELLLLSIPIGILIALILYVHSIMDFKPDLKVKKTTLVAILGSQQKAILLLPVLFVIAYGVIIAGVVLNVLPLTDLITLLTLPLAIKLVQLMRQLGRGDYGDIKRTWWMGSMEKGMGVGMDWFMVRWYLARNLMISTTLLIFVAYGSALAF